MNDWHHVIASQSHLSPQAALELREAGFVVIPGPIFPGGCEELAAAYDRAVAAADSTDVHRSKSGASTRINDFVNRGPLFDEIYIHPPLLAACCQIISGPFQLSGMRARTLHPGAPEEPLHVDVEYRGDGWPLVGCILMVDAFEERNGATRFVPGTHRQPHAPGDSTGESLFAREQETLACGPAGSMIVFNASVWHGHGANRSTAPRRSIQAHFIPRGARASPNDHARGMRQETLERIGDLAKYVLSVGGKGPSSAITGIRTSRSL